MFHAFPLANINMTCKSNFASAKLGGRGGLAVRRREEDKNRANQSVFGAIGRVSERPNMSYGILMNMNDTLKNHPEIFCPK